MSLDQEFKVIAALSRLPKECFNTSSKFVISFLVSCTIANGKGKLLSDRQREVLMDLFCQKVLIPLNNEIKPEQQVLVLTDTGDEKWLPISQD